MADPKVLAAALENGTIGQPYRTPPQQALGMLADLVNAYSRQADRVGVTMPSWSPVAAGKSLTLRDLTTGDLGALLENMSYGMGPMRGGNYATGGIGTYGLKPESLELLNAAPMAGVAAKGIQKGAKALAPTAAKMLSDKAGALMDFVGGRMSVVPDDYISPRSAIEIHGVRDQTKLNKIANSMKESGWDGDPLLAFDNGNGTFLLNGSHRVAAARKTGTDIPVVYVDEDKFVSALEKTGMTFDELIGSGDDRVADFLRMSGDEKAASIMEKEASKNR